jgi:CheY-like chemotaxis protein
MFFICPIPDTTLVFAGKILESQSFISSAFRAAKPQIQGLAAGTDRMLTPRILSVGSNPDLMATRTLLLRSAGFAVEEVFSVDKAIRLIEEDSIDLTLICHTVSARDQRRLIAVIKEKRRLMPVLCILSYAYESAPQACLAVDNDPAILLNSVKSAINPSDGN